MTLVYFLNGLDENITNHKSSYDIDWQKTFFCFNKIVVQNNRYQEKSNINGTL